MQVKKLQEEINVTMGLRGSPKRKDGPIFPLRSNENIENHPIWELGVSEIMRIVSLNKKRAVPDIAFDF